MQTRYWCRTCAAYGEGPCAIAGHISERMQLASGKWRPYKQRQLVVASPPATGRGSVEHVRCDAQGRPLSRSAS